MNIEYEKSDFIKKYFERLGIGKSNIQADVNSLKVIQKQHLLNVPFENLDIIKQKRISFQKDKIAEKILSNNRGGICYELNGLLFYLLRDIGFEVKYIAGRVLEDGNEFDHVFLMVTIDAQEWLVDVGFGDNFLEPLEFTMDFPKKDKKGIYKIVEVEMGVYELLKADEGDNYHRQYTFTTKKRELKDFSERCYEFETSPNSRFTKNKMCSLEKEDGRISLKDDKLVITSMGEKKVEEIENLDMFNKQLKNIYNIEY